MIRKLLRDLPRSVMGVVTLLILGSGLARAETQLPSAHRPPDGSTVSGTILAANADQLVVVTAGGARVVVVTLDWRAIGLWDGASSMNVTRNHFVPSLPDVAQNAAPLVTPPAELLLWTSSGPLILPVLGLFAIGTAGAVLIGRRIGTVFT